MPDALHAPDPLLLQLYRLAREAAPTQFLPQALHALRAQIPFDAACLCRCENSRGHLNIHSACLHKLPDSLITGYPAIEKQDPVATAVTRQPGTVQTFGPEDSRWQGHAAAQDYWQQHGFRHFHAIALPTGNTSNSQQPPQRAWLLALLSSQPAHTRQRQSASLAPLLPHLLESQLFNHLWALHQAEHVDIDHHGLATALYCPESIGYSLICGPNFDALLKAEFGRDLPEHGIRHLPAPLLALAKTASQSKPPCDSDTDTNITEKENPARHSGKQGVFTFYPQPAGHVLIHGRGKLPIDTLTKTERVIAELIAQGLTYKEIARSLNKSPCTIRCHKTNIRNKLNANNNAAVAALIKYINWQ